MGSLTPMGRVLPMFRKAVAVLIPIRQALIGTIHPRSPLSGAVHTAQGEL